MSSVIGQIWWGAACLYEARGERKQRNAQKIKMKVLMQKEINCVAGELPQMTLFTAIAGYR